MLAEPVVDEAILLAAAAVVPVPAAVPVAPAADATTLAAVSDIQPIVE